jgi:hypothetical protein
MSARRSRAAGQNDAVAILPDPRVIGEWLFMQTIKVRNIALAG